MFKAKEQKGHEKNFKGRGGSNNIINISQCPEGVAFFCETQQVVTLSNATASAQSAWYKVGMWHEDFVNSRSSSLMTK